MGRSMEHKKCLKTGWWYTYPSEKYEFVSWDDYSQYMETKKMFQTTDKIYIYFHFYTYSNFLSCFWTFYTYSVCLYIYVYDRVCSMLPGQKCWQDGIIPFLGRPGTGHRHGLFPLKSLLSSKQVPQRLQYLLMAAWFPIWGCRGIIIICWMIIFQIVIIYQWKKCW